MRSDGCEAMGGPPQPEARAGRRWRGALFTLALVIVSALLIAYLVRVSQPGQVIEALKAASVPLAAASVGVSLALYFVAGWRWRVVLQAMGHSYGRVQLARLHVVAAFFNNFLHTNVGGDVTRLAALAGEVSWPTVTASVLVERLLGVVALLLQVTVAILLHPAFRSDASIRTVVLIAAGGYTVGLLVLTRLPATHLDEPEAEGRWPRLRQKAWRAAVELRCGLAQFSKDRPRAVAAVALSMAMQALVSLVPVSLNCIGLAEGAYVLLLAHVGVWQSEALAFSFLARVLILVVSLIGVMLWLAGRRGRK